MQSKPKYIFIALGTTGTGISGGDRIYIELLRHWSKVRKATLFTSQQGAKLCKKQNLPKKNISIQVILDGIWGYSLVSSYIYRSLRSIYLGLTMTIAESENTILYSASEYWMDVFCSAILKLRYPEIKWIATWYQTAPNPLLGFAEVERENSYRLKAFLYWLMQVPSRPLINRYADKVIVNNKDEIRRFPNKDTIVLIGAVPLAKIIKYQKKNKRGEKKYEAVFQGRFSAQKGVVELVEIWNEVVANNTQAKLVMIGDGPLMNDVRERINKLSLENNVILKGYLFDGNKKYSVFSSSRLVLHPAFYDSGGMASAEAMAFGLPCVGFDLKAYKSYYPKGMLKVKKGDIKGFGLSIINLLSNKKRYEKLSNEARNLIESDYSWEKRSKQILNNVEE